MNAFVSGRILPSTFVDPLAVLDRTHHQLSIVSGNGSRERPKSRRMRQSVGSYLVDQFAHALELLGRKPAQFCDQGIEVACAHPQNVRAGTPCGKASSSENKVRSTRSLAQVPPIRA